MSGRVRPSGDLELDALFVDDAELADTARRARLAAGELPGLDEATRRRMRNLVMAEAERIGVQGTSHRRSWGTFPAVVAGLVGMVLVAATALMLIVQPGGGVQPSLVASVANSHDADPTRAITVSFNQPMDQNAVVAGLHIEPATAVTTRWNGNTLVITPVHPLAANTAYTVTVDRGAARTASGTTPPAPLQFSFGTAAPPASTPAPASPPALVPTPLPGVSAPTVVGFAPDGNVIVTGIAVSPTVSPVATAAAGSPGVSVPPVSASPTASAVTVPGASSPAPTASPSTVSPSPSPAPSQSAETFVASPGGASVLFGEPATVAALAPDGRHLALGLGGGRVVVESTDDHTSTTLDTAPAVALVWTTSTTLEVATGRGVARVTVPGHHLQTIFDAPAGEHVAGLSADGGVVVVQSPGHVRLVVLATGAATALAHSGAVWSGDAATLAWLDGVHVDVVATSALTNTTADAGVRHIDLPANLTAPLTLALNHDGTTLAVIGGDGTLDLLSTAGGTELSTFVGPVATATFHPVADVLALTTRAGDLELAGIGSGTTESDSDTPAGALTAVNALLATQTGTASPAPGLLSPPATAPANVRADHALLVDTLVNADGGVTAHVRLIRDATGGAPAVYAAETVTLRADGTAYVVTAVDVTAFAAAPPGPHVVRAVMHRATRIVVIAFDGDLDPTTVGGAVSATVNGSAAAITAIYDPLTRTVAVNLASAGSGTLTITVSTALHDIAGQSPAAAFTYTRSLS